MRPLGLLLALAALPVLADSLQDGPVRVEIFENVPAGAEPPPEQLATTYTEPFFVFARIPAKYSAEAFPLDRSVPFLLRASFERSLPPGEYRFRLRARGAAVLSMNGNELARTQPQAPNTSGDDPVPPPPVRDESGHRPPPYPHQDVFATVHGDGRVHRFTLTAIIGGKGLMPTPGELCVSFGKPGEIERVLGPDRSPTLTDQAWEQLVARQQLRHREADRKRRLEASKSIANAWDSYHQRLRERVKGPVVPPPSVKPGTPAYNDLDRFLGARLEEAGVAPTPLISDFEFLRRLSLDTIGMIPTADEIRTFLKDPPAERRERAIERLLNDPGWADPWVSYWQDVLAENPGILKPDLNNTGPFRWWLHQSFLDGIPFDRFVAELIQMEGSSHQGAPAAFAQSTLNDAPMAAKADIIAQAFLGQRLSCARCHDAPFHPFKQKDLFSVAAMLNGKPLKLPATSSVPLVEGSRKPAVDITLKPGDVIEPGWPFEELLAHAESGALPAGGKTSSRLELASLIVSPENNRFAQVIVNRTWKRYMGLGIVEPVDDWSRARPSHPELLQYLASEFVLSGYDLKHLARLILSSHAYQRRPLPEAAQPGAKDRLFAGPTRRRMSAEQLVDSLHRSVGKEFECEDLNLNPAGDRPPTQFLDMGKPTRAWQLTALSNERDRPALALPIAQSLVDVMTTYGWRQSRQSPTTVRDDAPSPMQTLILANGVLGTRIVRLSDDSALTELLLGDLPLEKVIEEVFLRVLSRPPAPEEARSFRELLEPYYAARKVPGATASYTALSSDNRVSWSNHLSAEATLIRMEEERKLRMGAPPTRRLKPEFRERFEDALWAMVNSPEFVLIP